MPAKANAADWAATLEEHRPRLRRLIALRLDRRVRRRVDPSDVIQETLIEATRRQGQYLADPAMPMFLWLRQLAGERLIMLHRRHLGAKARDVGRELALDGAMPGATSEILAQEIVGQITGPSTAAVRAEEQASLVAALDSIEPIDREILALRHFEQLSLSEAALALGISTDAAKKRHVRALRRLKSQLADTKEKK